MNQNQSLWSVILDDIAKESTMPESDMGVGKKTLMKALGCQHKKKDHDNKTPLICSYQAIPLIHPKAPSSSPIGADVNLNIYSISHQSLKSQLRFYINDSTIQNSIIAVVIDLTKPVEEIQRSIESWMDKIDQQFKVSEEQLNISKQNIIKYLRNYQEPTEDDENDIIVNKLNQSIVNTIETPKTPTTPSNNNNNDDDYYSTTPSSTNEISLFENCGIPIVIICTHCESIGVPQRCKIISNCLRCTAYKYRAAICYISIQESSNMNLLQLQTYLYHRLYPNVFNYHYRGRNEIKNIFIPSGWDNEDKLKTCRLETEENMRTPTPLTPSDNSFKKDEDDYILDPDCFINSLYKDVKDDSSATVVKKSISVAGTADKEKMANFYNSLRKNKGKKGGINKTPTPTPKESPLETP